MSYAISIECPTCGNEPFDSSITTNLAPMWRAAGIDFRDGYSGRPASNLITPLDIAIATLEADPDRFRAMNPENGWGDYDGLLDALRKLRDACRRVPTAVVAVSH